jgi:hydroxymethylbilane synthase
MTVRLGSRGSALARWQAEHVRARLETAHPGLQVEVRLIRTTGDRITDVPLARIGDRGLFTKEIDRAVLEGEVDIAVHSLKDMPTRLPDGLILAAVLDREDPRDALLVAPGRPRSLAGLPPGARVGTSSLRRRAQLLHRRPDLIVEDLRGNLDTRLARVAEGDYDAAILARAGIRRLGREDAIAEILEPPDWLPAPGQGALAVVAREDDAETLALVAPLDDPVARPTTTAERAFLRTLEGGCQIPIGALATQVGDTLQLHGFVSSTDGQTFLRGQASGDARDPVALGQELARSLLDRGAREILSRIYAESSEPRPQVSAP